MRKRPTIPRHPDVHLVVIAIPTIAMAEGVSYHLKKFRVSKHAMCNELSRMNKQHAVGAAICGGAVAGVALLGSLFNPGRGATREWYGQLEKPSFNPPDAVFAPVWTVLYVLIAISGYRVWLSHAGRERSRALALWGTQLALNGAWSPLFFGAKKPVLALGDIVLMLAAIASYTAAARKIDRPAAWLMSPYLAWVAFAATLNVAIVHLND